MKLSEKLYRIPASGDMKDMIDECIEQAVFLELKIAKAQKEMDDIALFFISGGTFSVGRASINLNDFKPVYDAIKSI